MHVKYVGVWRVAVNCGEGYVCKQNSANKLVNKQKIIKKKIESVCTACQKGTVKRWLIKPIFSYGTNFQVKSCIYILRCPMPYYICMNVYNILNPLWYIVIPIIIIFLVYLFETGVRTSLGEPLKNIPSKWTCKGGWKGM